MRFEVSRDVGSGAGDDGCVVCCPGVDEAAAHPVTNRASRLIAASDLSRPNRDNRDDESDTVPSL